jgi:hypothetical protein
MLIRRHRSGGVGSARGIVGAMLAAVIAALPTAARPADGEPDARSGFYRYLGRLGEGPSIPFIAQIPDRDGGNSLAVGRTGSNASPPPEELRREALARVAVRFVSRRTLW